MYTGVARHLCRHVFRFINATLFNEVVLRRDLCTAKWAMDVKMEISSLEDWAR